MPQEILACNEVIKVGVAVLDGAKRLFDDYEIMLRLRVDKLDLTNISYGSSDLGAKTLFSAIKK